MKKGFILLMMLFLASSVQLNASHLLGGEIIWECLPSGQYRFTVRLYRDCGTNTSTIPGAVTLSNNAGVALNCQQVSLTEVSPQCYLAGGAPKCGVNAAGEGAIQMGIYVSNPVTLNGSPPSSGWNFTWEGCCRPPSVTNIPLAGGVYYTLRAAMYPYVNPTTGLVTSSPPCYDSSPNFLEDPKIVACTGLNVTYNNLGFDPDLDSLSYSWAKALGINGVEVMYAPGYSYTSPLPSATQNSANKAATIDPTSGQVQFYSQTTGSFATVVKIEEWRCNQKIGEIFRDIPIILKPCTPNTGICPSGFNHLPTLKIEVDQIAYPNAPPITPVVVGSDTVYYEGKVYAKEKINFKITSFDLDFRPDCSFQNIEFTAVGGNLSDAADWSNPNSCLYAAPCATITNSNSNGTFISPLQNQVQFEWQTDCNHLTYQQFICGTFKSTYEFYFRMQDDACPAPAFSYATVKIDVLNYPPIPPDLSNSCVSFDGATGDLSFDWVEPKDTGINWDYYVAYHATNINGPYAAVDTFYNFNSNSYTHQGQGAGPHYYYMRSAGGCELLSEPSDTISLINMTLTPTPPTNSYVGALSWTPYKTGATTGTYYQIWRRIFPAGAWELVDSTTTLSYNDTVNVCSNDLEYQIRVGGGCHSTTDHALFSDQINNDVIIIDSVSVVNGQSTMSWQPTNSTDVDRYLVMIYDAGQGGWVVVDTLDATTYSNPYTYAASDANNTSEQFVIVTLDSCDNQSSEANAIAHNSIYLDKFVEGCDGFVRLAWNDYEGWSGTIVYDLYADVTDDQGVETKGVLINSNGTDTEYKHTTVINGYEYCYYVVARDASGVATSTSNVICVNSTVIQKSRLLYLASTNVRSNGSVEIQGFIDQDADVKSFNIERSVNKLGPYLSVGSVPMPTAPPYTVKYNDYTALADENRYYYRISAVDICDFIDTVSNFGTNINLSVIEGNLTNTLVWRRYEEYGGIVGNYSVYRMVDNSGNWQLVTDQLTATDTVFKDDITPYAEGKGSFCYYVVAVEANNPLGFVDENGQPFTSKSNEKCVNHQARLFIPNAFNVESDVLENRVWKPKNVFAEKDSYGLMIFNRWGSKVFSTNNVDEGWDGMHKGEYAPEGVYTYSITYKSTNGLPIEERGSFVLLK